MTSARRENGLSANLLLKRAKPYILPAALVLGLLLHSGAALLTWMVPYLVFLILLLNFSAVDLLRLGLCRLDVWVMLFQVVGSLGAYLVLRGLGLGEEMAEGAMACVLCPVASSVVVVASALGADRRTTTGYTIYGNLLVAVVAPIFFSFIGTHQEMPFLQSSMLIFGRIAPVIALPYFLALLLQWRMPARKAAVSSYKEWALPLWALTLFIVLGKTIDYIFLYHEGHEHTILWLGVVAAVVCTVQFVVGRRVGALYGQPVAGGQLFGQKNTGIGIWMATIFLTPLASVALAFYATWQNLFNSWQMWRYGHIEHVQRKQKDCGDEDNKDED